MAAQDNKNNQKDNCGNENNIPANDIIDDVNRVISDEEWDNPQPLEGKRLEIHLMNVRKARKLLFSVTILNIGLVALVAVILYKFFGHGAR